MRTPAPVCFNCGDPAPLQIGNMSPPAHMRWMCSAEKCWTEWIKQFDHGPSKKK